MAEVGLDLLADPEGPTGVEGKLADADPVGLSLNSVGPEGTPEGAGAQRCNLRHQRNASSLKEMRWDPEIRGTSTWALSPEIGAGKHGTKKNEIRGGIYSSFCASGTYLISMNST